jgi:N6-L-threonylcarbamoyladenine synthase
MAALYSSHATVLAKQEFAALHLSGGTSELLSVSPSDCSFIAKCVGGTADLNAGQVIDRVGVYMGLPFPAGVHMEQLALSYTGKIPKKRPAVKEMTFSLSGLENMAKRLFDETKDKPLTAAFVFEYISESILLICDEYEKRIKKVPFVFAGGVMSNSIIKKKISERLDAYFAEPALSADNAVGTAVLAMHRLNAESQ